jgi:hypothetical protein
MRFRLYQFKWLCCGFLKPAILVSCLALHVRLVLLVCSICASNGRVVALRGVVVAGCAGDQRTK